VRRVGPAVNMASRLETLAMALHKITKGGLKQFAQWAVMEWPLLAQNIMKYAASLRGVKSDVLLDGITLNTTPDNYSPIDEMRMMRFRGERWELFGDLKKGIRR
jgi:hypothetical protein